MRQLDLTRSAPGADQERTARLARHLEARLRDFGPGGPEVLSCDQRTGTVTARFPGHSTMDILEQLDTRFHIRAVREGPPRLLSSRESIHPLSVYGQLSLEHRFRFGLNGKIKRST